MEYLVSLIILTLILTNTSAQSTEDDQPYPSFSHPFAPSTVNFQDIYTNTFHRHADDKQTSPIDDEFLLNNIPTQFVEFHPDILKISHITPKSNVMPNSTQLQNTTKVSSTPMTVSTEVPVIPIKVLPKHRQRGVLDLLFPAARVKSFKNVFDSFRRVLSYTFRKK